MNTRSDAETTRRWLGIVGAVAVIAIPIALIGATWEPLEPMPRAGRPTLVDDAATPERTREERRNRRQDDAEEEHAPRRDRARGEAAGLADATPLP